MNIIETERLILRTWEKPDAKRFAEINQDSKVIELVRDTPMSISEAREFIDKMHKHESRYGFSLWAAECKSTKVLIGFIGLSVPQFKAHFTPCVEVGWRLAAQYWGKGYATEGAKAALEYGFQTLALEEILSFTVPANVRSVRVMEKLGMQRDFKGDFLHPKLPLGHRLSQHVLYRAYSSL